MTLGKAGSSGWTLLLGEERRRSENMGQALESDIPGFASWLLTPGSDPNLVTLTSLTSFFSPGKEEFSKEKKLVFKTTVIKLLLLVVKFLCRVNRFWLKNIDEVLGFENKDLRI